MWWLFWINLAVLPSSYGAYTDITLADRSTILRFFKAPIVRVEGSRKFFVPMQKFSA